MSGISEQDISDLVKSGQVDVQTAMQFFPAETAHILLKDVEKAVSENDVGKLQELRTNPGYNSTHTTRLIAVVQTQKAIKTLIDSLRILKQAEARKAQGLALSAKEQACLANKEKIEAQFNAMAEKQENKEMVALSKDLKSVFKGKGDDKQLQEFESIQQKLQEMEAYEQKNEANKPAGKYGYKKEIKLDADEKRDMEWLHIFEKGLGKFNGVTNGKDVGDMAVNFVFASMNACLETANEALKKWGEKNKADTKALAGKRKNHINDMMHANGTSLHKMAAQLSHDTQNWLLNDKNYIGLPDKPRNKTEKALIAKRNFARSLPKTQDGNIDFAKMSRRQKKQFGTYVAHMAKQPKWTNYLFEMSGLQLTYKEFNKIVAEAQQMYSPRVDSRHIQNAQDVIRAAEKEKAKTEERSQEHIAATIGKTALGAAAAVLTAKDPKGPKETPAPAPAPEKMPRRTTSTIDAAVAETAAVMLGAKDGKEASAPMPKDELSPVRREQSKTDKAIQDAAAAIMGADGKKDFEEPARESGKKEPLSLSEKADKNIQDSGDVLLGTDAKTIEEPAKETAPKEAAEKEKSEKEAPAFLKEEEQKQAAALKEEKQAAEKPAERAVEERPAEKPAEKAAEEKPAEKPAVDKAPEEKDETKAIMAQRAAEARQAAEQQAAADAARAQAARDAEARRHQQHEEPKPAGKEHADEKSARPDVRSPEELKQRAEEQTQQKQEAARAEAAPKTVRSDELTKSRDEALASLKAEALPDVTVSGSAKDPVVTLPDGSTVSVTDTNKDELAHRANKLKNEKAALDEQMSQNRQKQMELTRGREGKEDHAHNKGPRHHDKGGRE